MEKLQFICIRFGLGVHDRRIRIKGERHGGVRRAGAGSMSPGHEHERAEGLSTAASLLKVTGN